MKINNNDILRRLSIPSSDNGREFTNKDRLRQISKLLSGSRYKLIGEGNLFRLYGKRKLNKLSNDIILVSSHVDCLQSTPFLATNHTYIHGILDNAATNSVIVALMLQDELPDNVVIGFTGDEEVGSGGARELANYLLDNEKLVRFIVLDVTSCGWKEKADFIIENDFFRSGIGHHWGRKIIKLANASGMRWRFVSSQVDESKGYLDKTLIEEFMADSSMAKLHLEYDYVSGPNESLEYDKQEMSGFSLGLPCSARTPEEMHSNIGFDIRKDNYINYMIFLKRLLNICN